jgi:hypothetical protein
MLLMLLQLSFRLLLLLLLWQLLSQDLQGAKGSYHLESAVQQSM